MCRPLSLVRPLSTLDTSSALLSRLYLGRRALAGLTERIRLSSHSFAVAPGANFSVGVASAESEYENIVYVNEREPNGWYTTMYARAQVLGVVEQDSNATLVLTYAANSTARGKSPFVYSVVT